ncbi:membrane-spanning 4-domains subfamily A member 4A-like isoform X9 [Ursus americanus]|uniref:membrane-spanning 4-domains subfamily A member 4A-like isoform X4 n=1 Tax=Ursus arctos TaxID=9644 RepID=UPI001E67C92C|nr:membrane-spanning 4-domains subfamily A member 4A-like isoform X4 [Ursus arctos]XP_045643047.1 membrane-spanning 4-domains subfamily A member 4A-like isoform X9 [Ursus americanus]
MVLRNDGQEELSPPIWCSSRGTQSPKACVNTPEGATAWFGPNPPQKHIIQVDQTDPLKTFLKGEPQTLGVAQILIGLMKVCLFAIGLCFYSSGFSYQCHPLTMVSGYLIWGSLFFFVSEAVSIAAGRRMTLNLRVFETVILVLSLLEVSITISLSVFGCKVTCFVTQVVVIQPTNDQVPPVKAPYEHVYEDLEF